MDSKTSEQPGQRDGATSCIYAMRRHLAVPLPANVLIDDVYFPWTAFFQGFRVILEPRALCHNGIDIACFAPQSRPERPELTVGVVCALRPEKDIATLN